MHRYRITFLTGLAAGFVVGARAGRERYEQMKKLARTAADNPAVQQAAGAMQAQATQALKTARHKVTGGLQERMPKMAESARQAAGNHMPGRRGTDDEGAEAGNGERPFLSAGGRDEASSQP